MTTERVGATVIFIGLVLLALACSASGDGARVDVRAAKEFDEFPLYWVGERFEDLDLTSLDVQRPSEFVTFIYGDCTPSGGEQPSCTPPLELQVLRLCSHLDVVAQAPIWRRRSVRGAPVGTIDSAPVLFTRGAQVKVYRGEGSDPGLPWRVLDALRSVNDVEPVIGASGQIPAPAPEVLAGTSPCTA